MRKTLVIAVIGLLVLAACGQPAANATPDPRVGDLEARLSALENQLAELEMAGGEASAMPTSDGRVSDLETRLAALEGHLAELEAAPAQEHEEHSEAMAGGGFEVAMAQYVIDTAGFHGIDETLNETQVIEARYLSTVNRVRKVMAQTAWPEELAEPAAAFSGVLEEFAAALEADDIELAGPLATEAHTVQHDLSHAIDEALGTGGDHHGG